MSCGIRMSELAELALDVAGGRKVRSAAMAAILTPMDSSNDPNPEASDAEMMEEFARRPSTLPPIGVDLRSFPSEEFAKAVGAEVQACLYQLGKLLNLKRLNRVVVAYDYGATLAEIDRGVDTSRPLAATNNGIAVGIAMAPAILHEGAPRSVMVINANYASVLAQPESPETAAARDVVFYTLAHESAHVHDLEMQDTAFPGTILRERLGYRDGVLYEIASSCWEEYIACRLSAFMGKEITLRGYEDTFCNALERAKDRADAAIRQYRMHGDVPRITREVVDEYKSVTVYASYLLGHIDGWDQTVQKAAPKAITTMERHAYFKPFFTKLHEELRALQASYGGWQSLDAFEPLKRLAYGLLKLGGIDIQTQPDGSAHVAIPFTAETMPNAAEQMAFLAERASSERR